MGVCVCASKLFSPCICHALTFFFFVVFIFVVAEEIRQVDGMWGIYRIKVDKKNKFPLSVGSVQNICSVTAILFTESNII